MSAQEPFAVSPRYRDALASNLLFWGARHLDGWGFDTDENRPTNLQIPLVRG
jgi:hypothetical protein